MKTKVGKLNIMLFAIMLLLGFVVMFIVGKTNSWLIASDTIEMSVEVSEIDIEIKQGEKTVENEEFIYLGTHIIEVDKTYDLDDVNICNNEYTKGYYIRCQFFAKIGNVLYNINSCIENELYKSTDGWMYYTGGSQINIAKQMDAKDDNDVTKGVVPIIRSLTIPKLLENADDLGMDFSNYQGQAFELYLSVEWRAVKYDIT